MWELYAEHAADIRVGCYIILAIVFFLWGAASLIYQRVWNGALLALTGLYWIGSLHYALSRDPMIPLVFSTPVVFALAVCGVCYLIFNRIHE
jgi:hypothetical protein